MYVFCVNKNSKLPNSLIDNNWNTGGEHSQSENQKKTIYRTPEI